MYLTDRELKLILLAIDNTSTLLRKDATNTGCDKTLKEAKDMDRIYSKVLSEITISKDVSYA